MGVDLDPKLCLSDHEIGLLDDLSKNFSNNKDMISRIEEKVKNCEDVKLLMSLAKLQEIGDTDAIQNYLVTGNKNYIYTANIRHELKEEREYIDRPKNDQKYQDEKSNDLMGIASIRRNVIQNFNLKSYGFKSSNFAGDSYQVYLEGDNIIVGGAVYDLKYLITPNGEVIITSEKEFRRDLLTLNEALELEKLRSIPFKERTEEDDKRIFVLSIINKDELPRAEAQEFVDLEYIGNENRTPEQDKRYKELFNKKNIKF